MKMAVKYKADNGPEDDVKANDGLPGKAQENGQTDTEEMGAQETGVEEPHFVELLTLGFERSGDDVLQTVVAHQMAHERCDDGPDVGLRYFWKNRRTVRWSGIPLGRT